MFPNYLDGATVLMIAYLAEDSENEFVKKIFARINQQPRRKHRGIKPSARIKSSHSMPMQQSASLRHCKDNFGLSVKKGSKLFYNCGIHSRPS